MKMENETERPTRSMRLGWTVYELDGKVEVEPHFAAGYHHTEEDLRVRGAEILYTTQEKVLSHEGAEALDRVKSAKTTAEKRRILNEIMPVLEANKVALPLRLEQAQEKV